MTVDVFTKGQAVLLRMQSQHFLQQTPQVSAEYSSVVGLLRCRTIISSMVLWIVNEIKNEQRCDHCYFILSAVLFLCMLVLCVNARLMVSLRLHARHRTAPLHLLVTPPLQTLLHTPWDSLTVPALNNMWCALSLPSLSLVLSVELYYIVCRTF